MAELLVCVCESLESAGAGPVCWCGLFHGDTVPWDYCGECGGGKCGMAWVRLVGASPYSSFPEPIIDVRCQRPLAYYVEVGAMRCMPVADEDGTLPPPEVSVPYVLDVYRDMAALHRALLCCPVSDVAVETYLPLQGGGCAGGAWTAYLAID